MILEYICYYLYLNDTLCLEYLFLLFLVPYLRNNVIWFKMLHATLFSSLLKKMFICLQMLSQSAQNQEQMLHKFLGNTAIFNHKTSHFLILYTISTVHTQIT